MALSKMSLTTAAKIADLYCELCSKDPEVGKYRFYKYANLNHFEIIDIQNAFKILTSYKIFEANSSFKIDKAKEYADLAGGLLYGFHMFFAPDEIAEKINHLDKSDKLSTIEFVKLKQSIPQNEEWNNSETLSSFMGYLLSLDKKDENFWEKVYERIGISWDKNDSDDQITFIINNKNIFFNKNEQNKEVKEDLISADSKEQNKSIYNRHKYFFDQAITYLFLGLSIFFPFIRVLVFSIITILTGLNIYFWMQDPIKQKFILIHRMTYL